ncbi:MAG TPA: hypothetical protein DCF33_15180 [Saprospirales bacterium]|nr:hypothetical protein [Saprospirales bacterium]
MNVKVNKHRIIKGDYPDNVQCTVAAPFRVRQEGFKKPMGFSPIPFSWAKAHFMIFILPCPKGQGNCTLDNIRIVN